MDILTFVKSEKEFLKIQEGIGDNLSREDIKNGFQDYVLWSTFRPECIDLDQELEMELLDSGILYFRHLVNAEDTVDACFHDAYGHPPSEGDIITLMTGEDFTE